MPKSYKSIIGLILLVFLLTSQSFGLSVTSQPPSIDIITNAGGIKTFSLEISNVDPKQSVNLKIYTETIQFDKNGEVSFLAREKHAKSVADWIDTRYNKLTLAPMQKRNIPFQLHIPAGIPTGGYYAAVIVEPESKAPVGPMGLRIAFRLATIVRITIKGSQPLERLLEVSDFFYISGPIDPNNLTEAEAKGVRGKVAQEFPNTNGLFLVALLSNRGNIHFKAQGTALVLDSKQQRKTEIEMRGGTGIVYPGAGRYFIGHLSGVLAEGDYIAQLRFRYGLPKMLVKDCPFSIKIGAQAGAPQENVFSALEISPAFVNVEIPSAAQRTQKCTLTNRLQENLNISLSAEGELKDWIEFTKPNLELASAREAGLIFRINVPAGKKAGTYSGKIVLRDQNKGIEQSLDLNISVIEWGK